MTTKEYNTFSDAIKAAQNISDKDTRKALLEKLRAQLVAEFGVKDEDAQYLLKKCY